MTKVTSVPRKARRCANCGSTFTPKSVGRPPRFCSPTCRTAAYRTRRRNLPRKPADAWQAGYRFGFLEGTRVAKTPVLEVLDAAIAFAHPDRNSTPGAAALTTDLLACRDELRARRDDAWVRDMNRRYGNPR